MTVEDICLCLSPVTLSRFCFRVFFEAVARNRYIELDTNWPTATGGRGASRSDVDAPDHRREGTCVCVDGHSLGPAATLVGRSSRASFAAALPPRGEGSELVACVGRGSGARCFPSGFASAWARTGFCSRRGAAADTVFAGFALAAIAAGAGDAAVADAGAALRGSVAVRSFSTNAALSSRTCLIICSSAGASRTTAGGMTAGGCAGSCALPRREAATALAHPAPPISRILIMTFERCGKRPSIKHPLRLKRPVVFQTRV